MVYYVIGTNILETGEVNLEAKSQADAIRRGTRMIRKGTIYPVSVSACTEEEMLAYHKETGFSTEAVIREFYARPVGKLFWPRKLT